MVCDNKLPRGTSMLPVFAHIQVNWQQCHSWDIEDHSVWLGNFIPCHIKCHCRHIHHHSVSLDKKWVCVMGSQKYTILLLRWQLPLLTSCVYEEVQICKLLKREDKCRQLKWHCARLLRLPIKWLVTWSQELPGQWWCFRKDESTWISLQKLQMAGAMEALHNVMSIGIVTLWNNRKFSLLSPTLNGRETRRAQYDYK